MKLFDENFKYTKEASGIDHKIGRFLDSIYREVMDKGGSPRELNCIIAGANQESMCSEILRRAMRNATKKVKLERTNPTT